MISFLRVLLEFQVQVGLHLQTHVVITAITRASSSQSKSSMSRPPGARWHTAQRLGEERRQLLGDFELQINGEIQGLQNKERPGMNSRGPLSPKIAISRQKASWPLDLTRRSEVGIEPNPKSFLPYSTACGAQLRGAE